MPAQLTDRELDELNRTGEITERQQTIMEAMELLAGAEELIRSLHSSYLTGYVANHINSRGDCLGDQLYQILQKELKNE